MSHTELYEFSAENPPTDEQKENILAALRGLGFEVTGKELW